MVDLSYPPPLPIIFRLKQFDVSFAQGQLDASDMQNVCVEYCQMDSATFKHAAFRLAMLVTVVGAWQL
jgi:hypothetical protein